MDLRNGFSGLKTARFGLKSPFLSPLGGAVSGKIIMMSKKFPRGGGGIWAKLL